MRNFPTLDDAAAVVRPHNEQFLKDLRYSAFLEDVRKVVNELADGSLPAHRALSRLRRAIKAVEK